MVWNGIIGQQSVVEEQPDPEDKIMTTTTSINFLAGAMQFIVAAYALRLNLLFGTRRVGWSLFFAFSLLALLHLVQSVDAFNVGAGAGVKIEGIYLLVSFLLLTSLVHIEGQLRERLKLEYKERQIRAELELEVKRKTAYLVRALEGLQAEMDERHRMSAEVACLDVFKPRLFECFSEMIANISAPSVVKVLARESFMLGVDLVQQRPLMSLDVGSILVFSRFIAAGGRDSMFFAPFELPANHVAFYRTTTERLIVAGELPVAARTQFIKLFEHGASTTAVAPRQPAAPVDFLPNPSRELANF